MKKIQFILSFIFILSIGSPLWSQKAKKITIEHSDFADVNQIEIPDALLLNGNVRVNHDGAVLTCNKAYFFKKENYIKAFGNVRIRQGDTLSLDSKYAEYNGNKKIAIAIGDAVMKSSEAILTTDTIYFDRNLQEAYYNNKGTIVNQKNTLVSKSGRYYISQKKIQFLTEVTITNPTYAIKSNHLDYYTASGHSYLLGPSTIRSKANYIYTEKGFYDTKKNKAHFLNNSYIKYTDRIIKGDSLYYDANNEFASATRNVKIIDSINRGVVKGHYAEIYKRKDSLFVTKRAVAINFVENDSVYIHGKKLMVTGKENNRIIRGFNNVRFFKKDTSGKCDSIHSSLKTALTKLIGHPVIWNGKSQITGDIINLIGNNRTQKLDSIKVLNNTFIISKDTIGTGYNQIKGQNLYGKIIEGKLHHIDVIKNAEMVYFTRNDKNELIGINKNLSSQIGVVFDKNKIDEITFYKQVDGNLFPEKDLSENEKKLKGFVWREDEKIKSKEDIFPPQENSNNAKIALQNKAQIDSKDKPIKVRKETLIHNKNYKSNSRR